MVKVSVKHQNSYETIDLYESFDEVRDQLEINNFLQATVAGQKRLYNRDAVLFVYEVKEEAKKAEESES